MSRDHQVLIRRHNPNYTPCIAFAYNPGVTSILLNLKFHPKMSKPGADFFTHRCRVLADSPGENQGFQTAKSCGKSSNEFPHLIAEHPDGQIGSGISCSVLQ